MLSGLRPGTPVYVLYKNEPRFATAKVVSVSNQYPQYNFQQPLNPGNGPVIDLAIEVDGRTETYPRIPLNSAVAEFPDKGVILSETREGIVNEVNVIRGASQTALDQVEAHKRVIAACDQLLFDLNPQLKHDQEQATKIAKLEEQLAGMSDQIAALTGMLSKSLGKKSKDE
jgi:hypothetical protein